MTDKDKATSDKFPVTGTSSPSGQAATGSAASATKITSPSQPAGTAPGTGDKGSEKNLKKTEEASDPKETDEAKANRVAKENEEIDKETGIVTRKLNEDNEDKPTTVISAVDSEAADKHIERIKNAPAFENQTQSLLGTPGNVDLTQGGTLAGDKSVREDVDLEDVNAEMEEKAGPNPLPNREGNEMLKASNFVATAVGTGTLGGIDRKTNKMAKELKELSKKDSLSQADKDRLTAMSKQLEETGRVPVA